jgi:hypothetical protein
MTSNAGPGEPVRRSARHARGHQRRSFDGEAASMTRLRRSYGVGARLFTTVNETLDVPFNPGR